MPSRGEIQRHVVGVVALGHLNQAPAWSRKFDMFIHHHLPPKMPKKANKNKKHLIDNNRNAYNI